MRKNFAFRNGFLGTVLPAVLEGTKDAKKDAFIGLTDNYIKVSLRGAKRADIGRMLNVRITTVEEQKTEGEVV